MELLDMFIRLTVQDDASENIETLSQKFKSGLATAAKIGAAAVSAAAAGIAALTKNSVEQYAEYEQLVGGVETLFGAGGKTIDEYAQSVGKSVSEIKDEYNSLMSAQTSVFSNASKAYKNVGLSANEYMNTVTSFAASLVSSLGGNTEEAAKKADLAITDMADNANKMGTGMEAIQNAYQGFAKQNYTMLDNLKLGYGGTKEEMERLLETANEINAEQGVITDYQIDSYADIVDAIHVVQTEMGITGTTAEEASSTIQGSVSAMSSAWSNLVTGLADDEADFDSLMDNFVDSAVTVGENIIPRIETTLNGISQLVSSASGTIVPLIIQTITDNLPSMLTAAVDLIGALGQGLIDSLPALTEAAIDIILYIADSLIDGLPSLIDALVEITVTITDKLSDPSFISQLIETAILLITTLATGLIDAVPQLVSQVPIIIGNLLAAITAELPDIITMGINLLFALIDGIIETIPELVASVPTLIIAFVNGVANNLDKILLAAPKIVLSLITGIIGTIPELIAAVPKLISAISDTIKAYDWAGIGKNIVQGLKNGIANMWSDTKSWFTSKVSGLVSSVKNALGIHSPSKVFAGIGENMALGLGEGWEDEFGGVKDGIEGNLEFNAGTVTAAGVYSSGERSIYDLLQQYLPALANMQIFMDNNQLVGVLAPGIDSELARISARRGRVG